MLDLLEDFMHLRGIPFARLDGSTVRPRRTLDIRLFQKDDSPYKVFLVSTKAGGLGINLTKATTVIMADSDWNPQNDLQAIARAHRIGQKKIVKVYRLICRGSVEDQMLDRIRRKLFLSIKLMGSDNASSSSSSDNNVSMGMKELMDILRKGSSALSNEAGHDMNFTKFVDMGIDEILDASRGRESARDAKLQQELSPVVKFEPSDQDQDQLLRDAEAEQTLLLSGVAVVQARLFEGKVVQSKLSKNREIADEWRNLQRSARVRTGRCVAIGGMSFVVEPITETVAPPTNVEKRSRIKFEWDDWCIYCRDGGEVVCCGYCPRVFHASCRGYTNKHVRVVGSLNCSQHNCHECERTTSEGGGMLFRCRTCPKAFCEDCLPEENIEFIGDIIPEYSVQNYPQKSNAYYIGCHYCHERAQTDIVWWKEWQMDIKRAAKKLAAMQDEP